MKLANHIALVTAGARRIGRAIALQLAQEGANVVVASRTLEPAIGVVAEIEALGRRGLAMEVDVSCYEDVKQAVSQTLTTFGSIDVLVNNAGGSARGKMSQFCDSEEETWDFILNSNLKGVFYTCRQVIGHMLEKGSGSIINIGSVAGMVGFANQVDYSAAKGGVIAFTQALAKETVSCGVRVNCVSPGPTVSDAARTISDEVRQSSAWQVLASATGFGRFGEPQDIARMVAFLASEDAAFITGQNIPVCGVMNLGIVKFM